MFGDALFSTQGSLIAQAVHEALALELGAETPKLGSFVLMYEAEGADESTRGFLAVSGNGEAMAGADALAFALDTAAMVLVAFGTEAA